MNTTVVIVNWNGGSMLRDCLASLRMRAPGFPVVVVDNDSSDGSREEAQREFPEYCIFSSGDNLGFARGNNLAQPHVNTSYVLFLNPDTIVLGDALQRMERFLDENPDVGLVGCKMRYPGGEVQEQGIQLIPTPWTILWQSLLITDRNYRRFKHLVPYLDPNKCAYATKLYGGCMLVRKEILDQIGWLDERYFMYAEDVDLCRTLRDRGWKLYYLSDAEIIHLAGGTSKNATSGFSTLMMSESIAKFMRKYHGNTGAFAYRFVVFTVGAARIIPALLLGLVSRLRGEAYTLRGPFLKYKLMILWALGLRRAFINTSRCSSSATSLKPAPPQPLRAVEAGIPRAS